MAKLGSSSKNVAIPGKVVCDVIPWNSPCRFAMRNGKNELCLIFFTLGKTPVRDRVNENDIWI